MNVAKALQWVREASNESTSVLGYVWGLSVKKFRLSGAMKTDGELYVAMGYVAKSQRSSGLKRGQREAGATAVC